MATLDGLHTTVGLDLTALPWLDFAVEIAFCAIGDADPSPASICGRLAMFSARIAASWFDNDWQDMDITIDRDLVVISEVTMADDS
jgi:hypothetical protein